MTMTYTAQAIGVFTVTSGAWYDEAMIAGFYDQLSPNSAFAKNHKPLFGDGGLLNLRASQIYVALRRSIVLTGTSDAIAQVNGAFQQNSQSSFSIGGLFWSSTGSQSQGSRKLVGHGGDLRRRHVDHDQRHQRRAQGDRHRSGEPEASCDRGNRGVVQGTGADADPRSGMSKAPGGPRSGAGGGAFAGTGMNQALWQTFVAGLASQTLLAVDPATFKIASGLAPADWETLDLDGAASRAAGVVLPAFLYGWADPQPALGSSFYVAGDSLSDSYSAFLNALVGTSSGDRATIAAARQRLARGVMIDAARQKWPAYQIAPGLDDFLLASLQSRLNGANAVDFTMSLRNGSDLDRRGAAPMPFVGIDLRPIAAGSSGRSARAGKALPNSVAVDPGPASSCRFQVGAIEMFAVMPGRWFDQTLIETFSNCLDPASALAGQPLTGPQGLFKARVSQILVAIVAL